MKLSGWDIALGVAAFLMAVFYTVFAQIDIFGWAGVAYAVLSWLFVPAVTLWRTFPRVAPAAIFALLAAWCVVWLATIEINTGITPWLLTVLLAIYAPARYAAGPLPGRIALVAALIGTFVSPVMWAITPELQLTYRTGWDLSITVLAHWGVVVTCYLVALRRRQQAADRAQRVRAAREEERLAIAREIHDVLAHSLTLITVQANAGLVAGQERDALAQIKNSAAAALGEVRGIVGELRGVVLMDVESVIEQHRASGLDVSADITDVDAAPSVQRALVRVVGEALTNARRHQVSPQVRVTVQELNDDTLVQVISRGAKTHFSGGSGVGLVGLEERVESLGGTFAAVGEGQTFTVTARMRRLP